MRIWTINPAFFSRTMLLSAWRDGLAVQTALAGGEWHATGPGLSLFLNQPAPLAAIGRYLWVLAREASERLYTYDARLIRCVPGSGGRGLGFRSVPVSEERVRRELDELRALCPEQAHRMDCRRYGLTHPLFYISRVATPQGVTHG